MKKPKALIGWNGPDGNLFALVGIVAEALNGNGMGKEAKKVKKRFVEMSTEEGVTYKKVIEMFEEYVEFEPRYTGK